jgi:hypothetical protein
MKNEPFLGWIMLPDQGVAGWKPVADWKKRCILPNYWPFFLALSTEKFRRPQFLHNEAGLSYCTAPRVSSKLLTVHA